MSRELFLRMPEKQIVQQSAGQLMLWPNNESWPKKGGHWKVLELENRR